MAQQQLQQRKTSSDTGFISKYINEQNNSSDEEKEIEMFESPDYEPFVAKFRKYKPEMTQVEKESILTRGLINLRINPHMRDIMVKMFDYDLEVSDLEAEIFLVKEKIETVFNFIDVSFQLLDGPFEKTVALLNKQMEKLRNYYDRKATLNMAQSESIVDLFRFFARKDSVLSKVLNGDFSGFTLEFEPDLTQESEQKMDTTSQEPQPKSMEVESQPKIEWLCNKKLWVSDFELTLDGLVGDGSHIITELMDWESSGPTYSFNELRDILCEKQRHVSMQISCIYLVLPTLEGIKENFDHQDN